MSGWPSRRQVLHGLGLVVLVAILVPFVVYAVPGAIGADASHVVLSGSMAPAIEAGDVVIVRDVDAETIDEGDIVTFQTPTGGLPTTHRVTKVLGTGADLTFRTKGDANEDPDPQQISPDELRGEVILIIPYIGHVILFATTRMGFALLLGLPFGLLILSEAWLFAKEGRSTASGSEESVTAGKSQQRIHVSPERRRPPAVSRRVRASAAIRTPTSESIGEAASGGDDSSTITVTTADLRLSLVLMGMFLAYAGYIVYRQWVLSGERSAVSVAVAVGTLAAFAIMAGLALGTRRGSTGDDEGEAGGTSTSTGRPRVEARSAPDSANPRALRPRAAADHRPFAQDGGARPPSSGPLDGAQGASPDVLAHDERGERR